MFLQQRFRINSLFVSSFTLLATTAMLAPAYGQIAREGDVTISATSEEDAKCDDCPDDVGTKICYEITRAGIDIEETTDSGQDFHILVNDALASNFACFSAERRKEDGTWEKVTSWESGHASQVENNVTKHYVSWYTGGSNPLFKVGETWRFCVVYCGATSNLGNTFDYIMTDSGNPTPAIPNKDGNRDDVPDVNDTDDPAWKGQEKKAEGSKVGWITYRADSEPFYAGQETVAFVNGATPGQMQYLVYSLRGPGATWVEQLGVELSLRSPKLAKKAPADAYGSAYFDLFIPPGALGREVWLQVAEQGRISNVMNRVIG